MTRHAAGVAVTDLFLSYKAEDRARIGPLVRALEEDGFSVWWDAHIGGGDSWRDTILRHLEEAKCVLVVWSRRSVGPEGEFVRDEASRAQRRKTYFPVRIDKVDPPLGFGEIQALDLSGWKGARSDPRYQAVLEGLRRRIGVTRRTSVETQASPPRVSRRTILIGSGAAIAAAGAGGWMFLGRVHGSSSSIAVLPFANLSGDPAEAYFSDGIAEELRTALSRIEGLKVVARTSSEAVRDEDAKTAAHKLGVANILMGSVRRSPGVFRISAQLVDGNDGVERWSEVYDRPAADALVVQSDISNRVAEALSIRLAGAARKRLEEGGTANADAHDLVLKARGALQGADSPGALQRAIGLADAAIALDPQYAGAWSTKSQLQTIVAGAFAPTAAEAAGLYAQAKQSAERAIKLAPNSRMGYTRLADILDQRLERRAARAEYERMQALPGEEGEPSYAIHLSETLHYDEAKRLIDHAISVDPLNAGLYFTKAYVFGNARRYDEALAAAREFARVAGARKRPHALIAYFLMLQGKYDEAEAEFDQAGTRNGAGLAHVATLRARTGDFRTAEQLLDQMRASGDNSTYQQAQILAQIGRKDDAVAALERAVQLRDSGVTAVLVDPLLDPIREDPRFAAVVKRLDFPN